MNPRQGGGQEVPRGHRGEGAASVQAGTLYLVATPIGNLADITLRALEVLGAVDEVLAEDTRRTRRLLEHYRIRTPMGSVHEHNERARAGALIERLRAGAALALVSDAGTPTLSDPGFPLTRAAIAAGVPVVSVPGASALLAALPVSGLPVERFAFEGFLPSRRGARRRLLESLVAETRTVVFYEAPHRIVACLRELVEVLGPRRPAAVARELTKRFESVRRGSLGELLTLFEQGEEPARGELVVMVSGASRDTDSAPPPGSGPGDRERVLRVLLREMAPPAAARAASALLGEDRRSLYRRALELREGAGGNSPGGGEV